MVISGNETSPIEAFKVLEQIEMDTNIDKDFKHKIIVESEEKNEKNL